ncbi:hypothetical protein QNH23_05935 [Siminovitchia fortis]|uniref:Uncharacterized protein n=1 Tax=Siminovitchia fortis TaxID=254758 RepID=A0A443IRX6_9BACI|nr:hypothetical protein [Siminovitchia fortis]RWR10408.1 hypothetical protein D4N35_009930 [Siminovitchia fortis]WHY82916.1 hypothetical protein QNH23_05935 [Siminovitchia fortis]
MNLQDCLNKLAEIKDQLDLLEEQIAEKVRDEESNEKARMSRERREIDRKLAQLELKNARERIRQYHVS